MLTANIEAEQSVIGSILIEGELIQETTLEPVHFSRKSHQYIFDAIRNVDGSGQTVDLVTVTTKLGDLVNEIGGMQYMADLISSIATTANFHSHEQLVFDAYRLRESRKVALSYAENPTDEKLNELYEHIGNLQELGIHESPSTKDLLVSIAEDISMPSDKDGGTDTGLADLNTMTGGLRNSDLIIIAGRPGMGKTAFALNLAKAGCEGGAVTNLFSLEMSNKQLLQRMISMIGGINGIKWRDPYQLFSSDDHHRATTSMGIIREMELHIHDQPGQSVYDIRAAVRKSMRNKPDDQHLVVIDYLQLMTSVGHFDRHDLAIGHITRELKKMAREFDIPVVLLSQLSRSVEARQDKRPVLSDLRDSGNIEQDADVVMFLYRDDYYNQEETTNITEIIIAKQRNGETGKVEAVFQKEHGTFRNLERHREAAL